MIPSTWTANLMASAQVQALGWALLQFLWLGTLVALLTAGALVIVRQSARARYTVGVIGLFSMLVTFLTTLAVTMQTWQPSQRLTADVLWSTDALQGVQSWGQAWFAATIGTWLSVETIQLGLSWLTVLWVLGVLWFQLRLLLQWNHLATVRRRAHLAAPSPLQSIASELQGLLGIRQTIRVLETATLSVPAVVGWLDPIVLVPMGILGHLSTQQLRAVLAHELAHLRRNDHLVNLLQCLTESLLFFHPAVWWLSNQIRIEREFCCDDLAVDVCGDTLSYARALQTLEDLRAGELELSRKRFGVEQVAVASTGGSLMDRITRLFGVQPASRTMQSRWGVPAVLAILMSLALFAASCEPKLLEDPQTSVDHNSQEEMAQQQQATEQHDLQEANLQKVNNHLLEALENGDITQEQYRVHKEFLDQAHAEWQQDDGTAIVELKDGNAFVLREHDPAHFNGEDLEMGQLHELLEQQNGALLELSPEALEELHGELQRVYVEGADGEQVWVSEEGSKSLQEILEKHPELKSHLESNAKLHTQPLKESVQ